MAQKYTLNKYAEAFETNMIASTYGEHVYNLLAEEDIENGSIVGRGDYVDDDDDLDVYKIANAPEGFELTLRRQMNNGNWLVEVTKLPQNADVILVRSVPVTQYDYTNEFKQDDTFYIAAGEIARGLVLHFGDKFEVSAKAFASGTPAKGAKVTTSTKHKMVIGE